MLFESELEDWYIDESLWPKKRQKDIGKHLVLTIMEEYKDYARKVLIAYDKEIAFYNKCGFEEGEDKTPVFVTYDRSVR
jgi:hypothetical protein